MKESIIRLETDKLLKKRSPEELEKIISGVEEQRLGLIRELKGLHSAIDGISSSRNWVNWVQKFSKRIDDLDPLTPEEREDFLKNTITEIRVETLDQQTNRLNIEFLTTLVDDALEWTNPKDKRLGYELIDINILKNRDFYVGKGVPLGC